MNQFEYYAPTGIIFGKDVQKQAGEKIKAYGGTRVLIVYGGSSAVKSGLLADVETSIKKSGLEYLSTGGVIPNPVLSTVRKMIKEAIDFNADFILAVGGGSVIDTAKAVAHGVASPDIDIWDYFAGKEKVKKSLPHACVLTISAAGSETSNSAVITNDEETPTIKIGINTDFNRCKFALMNPELTYTLPKYQIAAGVADIFMHTSERYFSEIRQNHLSDEMAEGLFRTIIKYGKIGVDNQTNYEAMSEIMWCGSISHVGLTGLGCKGTIPTEGDWACHQLGMSLSAIYDSTHGATLSALWGTWARYVMEVDISRFANYARKVFHVNENDDKTAALKGITLTEQFFQSIGMPVNLHELCQKELTEEEINALADNCSRKGGRQIGSFKRLDRQDMYNIYKTAL